MQCLSDGVGDLDLLVQVPAQGHVQVGQHPVDDVVARVEVLGPEPGRARLPPRWAWVTQG